LAFPEPLPGLVIRYSYLWRAEQARGQEEGVKDRPCAIVLSSVELDGARRVVVLPITHAPPKEPGAAIEIPAMVKERLGLDGERSWVVLTEANRFIWPGPDVRPTRRGDPDSVVFGPLPYKLFEAIRQSFIDALKEKRTRVSQRTE
jgi:hypothetical protein